MYAFISVLDWYSSCKFSSVLHGRGSNAGDIITRNDSKTIEIKKNHSLCGHI